MADSKNDIIIDWLRDAHAMEQQAEALFEKQAERMDQYPDLQGRLRQHVKDICDQQKLLKQSVERLGGKTSVIKDLGGKVTAWGQTIWGLAVNDEVVKGAMGCYVFQHMAIASYRILITAAQNAGDAETAAVCERILQQEITMADWLHDHLPDVTTAFVEREAG